MTGPELQGILDELGLAQAEAARHLYLTTTQLGAYLQGRHRIPGPLKAAVEAWQRHGLPPGAKRIDRDVDPKQLRLMRELRDSLADAPTEPPKPRKARKGKETP